MLASPATGQLQLQCGVRAEVLEFLSQKFQEAPVAGGITTTGSLIEILTDPDGGTWTIIVTSPQGLSCVVSAGEDWRELIPKPPGAST